MNKEDELLTEFMGYFWIIDFNANKFESLLISSKYFLV